MYVDNTSNKHSFIAKKKINKHSKAKLPPNFLHYFEFGPLPNRVVLQNFDLGSA